MQFEKAQRNAKAHPAYIAGPLSRFLVVLLAVAMSLAPPPAVLAQQPVKTDMRVPAAVRARADEDDAVRPFRVRFPEEALADLRRRISATRWPERETVEDF